MTFYVSSILYIAFIVTQWIIESTESQSFVLIASSYMLDMMSFYPTIMYIMLVHNRIFKEAKEAMDR